MKLKFLPFGACLVLLGGGMAAGVAFDLGYRGLRRAPPQLEWSLPGADARRGKRAIREHGCGACHHIPGIRGATGRVGPKLEDFGSQMYVAGVLANRPENLVRWIRHPQQINPRTAMPDLDVPERDARDIAAYLSTLR